MDFKTLMKKIRRTVCEYQKEIQDCRLKKSRGVPLAIGNRQQDIDYPLLYTLLYNNRKFHATQPMFCWTAWRTWRYTSMRFTKYVHIKSTTVYAPRRNWDSPQPPTHRLVCSLPPVSGGRGTLAGEKGVGRVPIPMRGIHCGTLYMYIFCDAINLP